MSWDQNTKWSAVFVLILVSTNLLLHSQSVHYRFEEVQIPKEYENFYGMSILQDSDGFMWFGSKTGLIRYDGANFKHYSFEMTGEIETSQGTARLANYFVKSLMEDDEGAIWFVSKSMLIRFDRKTEKYEQFWDPKKSSQKYTGVECGDGYIWLGSQYGLYRFDKRTGTFVFYLGTMNEDGSLIVDPVHSIYEDHQGTFWIIYLNGDIAIFDRKSGALHEFNSIPAPVTGLFEDRTGRFWMTTKDGLYLYNRESNNYYRQLYLPEDPDRLGNQYLGKIIQGKAGDFWISTGDGIYHYSESLNKLGYWNYPIINSLVKSKIVEDFSQELYLDNNGTLWFFTGDGIGKLTKQFNNFTQFDLVDTVNACRETIHTENKYFITIRTTPQHNGYYMLDRITHTCSRLLIDDMGEIDEIRYSIIDRKGNLWVSSYGNGLYRGKRAEDGSVHFERVFSNPKDSSNIPSLNINRIFEDSRGRIWIEARDRWPCYYDPDQDRIIHVIDNPQSMDKLPRKDIIGTSLGAVQGETNKGILMASHRSYGIFALIPPFIKVSEHAVMPSNLIRFRTVSDDKVVHGWDMYQFPDDTLGIIWTRGGDVSGFQKLVLDHPEQEVDFSVRSKVYSEEDGLPIPHVFCILADDYGNFWLGTADGGLSQFNPEKSIFKNFNENDGLPGKYIGTAVKSEDGEMFFALDNGNIFSVNPDSLVLNTLVPPVLITDLRVNNRSISPGDSTLLDTIISYKSRIKLAYNQNNISLSYAALNYIQPFKNQYRYRLDGFLDEWVPAGNSTRVDYTNLAPGHYTFRVIGSNNDGIWNETGAILEIRISPPPWLTPWAYIFYALLITGVLYAYRRYLINREKMKASLEIERMEKEKIREIDQIKSRFFANITHEFRTPLTLILGPAENVLRSKKENITMNRSVFESIRKSADRLLQLVNQLLDISKLESGSLKLQVTEGDLVESIKPILLSYISLAESKKIVYSYDLPVISLKTWFDIDKVHKITGNLITNAIKYTPAGGSVKVVIRYVFPAGSDIPERIELTVEDTGSGITHEAQEKIFDRFYQVNDPGSGGEGTGIGLALVKELVDLNRGEINLRSEPGLGSTFRVSLPVRKDQFHAEEIQSGPTGDPEPAPPLVVEPESEGERDALSPGIEKKEAPDDAPLILIVEDNLELASYISGILDDQYRILSAANGSLGLEVARENIPDLVISDLMMPVMDGLEFCGKIKEDRRTNHIPFILLTARADRESKLEGLGTGVDDYIIKPFDAEELKTRIRNLILQREKLREHFRQDFLLEDNGQVVPASFSSLKEIVSIIDRHLEDPDFHIRTFSEALSMSRSQLFRKIENITGTTPNELIRLVRMKRAAQLLRTGVLNVTQVMYQVGMTHPSHFASSFRKYYGVNPSEYKNHRG